MPDPAASTPLTCLFVMQEIRAHTGLRGVTAIAVMFFHLSPDFFFAGFSTAIGPFLFGHQAVDLFFILSGFILCYVYAVPGRDRPRGGYRAYHVARFARVYPLHFVTMAALGLMAWALLRRGQITGDYHWIDVLRQLLLVNAYPYLSEGRTWNYPAWSISIEYLAYLVIFPLFLRWRPAKLSAGSALAWIGLLTLLEILYILCVHPANAAQNWLWIGVIRGTVGFLTGCLLHHVFTFHPLCTAFFQRHALVFTGLALTMILLAGWGWFSLWWLLLAWPPLVLALTSDNGLASRLLSTRVALLLGNLSYSIYMLHAVAGKIANVTIYRHPGLLKPPLLPLAGVVYLSSIVLVSWLSFRFFEMPVRFWLRTRLNRSPESVGPPSAALVGGEGVRHGHPNS